MTTTTIQAIRLLELVIRDLSGNSAAKITTQDLRKALLALALDSTVNATFDVVEIAKNIGGAFKNFSI